VLLLATPLLILLLLALLAGCSQCPVDQVGMPAAPTQAKTT